MSEKIEKDWAKVREQDTTQDEKETALEAAEQEAETKTETNENIGIDHPSYAQLEEKLTEAEQKASDNWEKCVRTMAEADNIRRRAERDVANAHRYGLEKFVDSLLPVVDSLEQAHDLAIKAEDSNMSEGLELTNKLLLDALAKHGVEQLSPEGEAFDPQQHEAMSMLPAQDVADNTVINVFQKGYKLNDRVIRPARVIVAKAQNK